MFDPFGLALPPPRVPTVLHQTTVTFQQWRSEEDFHLQRSPVGDPFIHYGNLVTSGGVNAIWSLVTGGTSPLAFNNTTSYIAMGSSTTAAASGQTTLVAELGRKAATVTVQNIQITWTALFGTGDANGNWNEVAILNASSAGTMLNRAVLAAQVTKNSGNVYSVVVGIVLG